MRFADWKAGMNVCLSTRRGAGVDKCAELGGLSTRTQESVEGGGHNEVFVHENRCVGGHMCLTRKVVHQKGCWGGQVC